MGRKPPTPDAIGLPRAMHGRPVKTLASGMMLILAAGWIGTQPAQNSALLLGSITAALLALIYPWLVWMVLAFLLPAAAGIRLAGVSPADLLLVTAVGLWAARSITRRTLPFYQILPLWLVAIYVFTLLLSTLGAQDLGEALIEVVKWVEFGLILLVLPLALQRRHIPWLIGALLAAAALQGLLGLYQFIFRIGPEWFLIQDRFMRSSGLFGQPNPYAGYLGLSWPVALSLSLWASEQFLRRTPFGRRKALVLALSLLAAGCIGVGLVTSWSRGGWLAALAGTLVVFALYSKHTRVLLMGGLIAAGSGVIFGAVNPEWVPTAVLARVSDLPAYFGANDLLNQPVTDENFAVIERLAHWAAAVRMWESAFWLGVGPGNYAAVYSEFALPGWPDPLGHAHNIYLNVLGETGLVGGAAFFVLWGGLLVWLLSALYWPAAPAPSTNHSPAESGRLRQNLDQQNLATHRNYVIIGCHFGADAAGRGASWIYALGVGVVGILAHLAVHSFFDNLFVQGMYLHVALWLAGFAAAATKRPASSTS